jgi:hypothetical protein
MSAYVVLGFMGRPPTPFMPCLIYSVLQIAAVALRPLEARLSVTNLKQNLGLLQGIA